MLIPSSPSSRFSAEASLSRRVNANSQQKLDTVLRYAKLIKKGEC